MFAISSIPVAESRAVRPSILCADASPEILEICRTILTAGGYQVFTVSTGAAALEFLEKHPVNAVIIDDAMTDFSGVDLAREIRRSSRNVVVVMYSAELNAGEELPFVDSLLYKGRGPIALRELLGTLLQK